MNILEQLNMFCEVSNAVWQRASVQVSHNPVFDGIQLPDDYDKFLELIVAGQRLSEDQAEDFCRIGSESFNQLLVERTHAELSAVIDAPSTPSSKRKM